MSDVVQEVVREAAAIGLTEYPVGLELSPSANVRGDPLELKLIVYNFIKNSVEAARESCSGDPGIKVRLVAEREAVKLVCSDQASEITPRQLERIRSRQATTTKTKGLGLGLSVVRAIIESHAGTVAFEHNDQGKGLKVVVSLPRNYEQGAGQ